MDTEKYKLYTKGGDKGRTSLVGGQRVPKYDIRLESYGTIDELNSFVGVLLSHDLEEVDRKFLFWLQHKLFSVGGYLATDTTRDEVQEVTRTVCRRAERIIYRLNSETPLEPNVLRFINRLSDYFFALARKEVFRINGEEIVWTYDHEDL